MNNLNSGGIPLNTELVDARDIWQWDRIIQHQCIKEVVSVLAFGPIRDETIEFEVFSKARGYEKFTASPRDKILLVIEEGPNT